MKTAMYRAGKFLVRFVFGCVARIDVIGRENANHAGGFLLASNHISHFDPFLIGLRVRRKIDWMTMAEFFRPPALGFFLRSIDAFPAERDRADLKTIRTAIDRLKRGRIVGIFPEGGIRDGARSLLEGAPLRAGAATLAQIADVPIVPCVILGTDRLYSKKQWLPFRRTPVWIAFGKPISCFPEFKNLRRANESIPNWLPLSKIFTPNCARNFTSRLMICQSRHENVKVVSARRADKTPQRGVPTIVSLLPRESIRFSVRRSIGCIDATH